MGTKSTDAADRRRRTWARSQVDEASFYAHLGKLSCLCPCHTSTDPDIRAEAYLCDECDGGGTV